MITAPNAAQLDDRLTATPGSPQPSSTAPPLRWAVLLIAELRLSPLNHSQQPGPCSTLQEAPALRGMAAGIRD